MLRGAKSPQALPPISAYDTIKAYNGYLLKNLWELVWYPVSVVIQFERENVIKLLNIISVYVLIQKVVGRGFFVWYIKL